VSEEPIHPHFHAQMTDSKADVKADAKTAAPATLCLRPGCGKASNMQCPKCVEMSLPKSAFCSQECFKANWKEHNEVHKGQFAELARVFDRRRAAKLSQFSSLSLLLLSARRGQAAR
jgi:hypothetical protein